MVGKKAGVVKRLKDQTNRAFIQGIHCSAQFSSVELSFKDATKDLSLWTKPSNLLLGVYLFYRNSPLNRSNLLQAFAMEDVEVLIPSRVGGTRWVSHIKRALRNLMTSYRPMIQHLQQIQNPCDPAHNKESARKAVNFLKHLQDKSMVAFLLFMWDIVCCLSAVSEAFQRKEATLEDVYVEIQLAKNTLTNFYEMKVSFCYC
ncbi:uncharacterized protein [Haliotis cracherodii]|uniref:uncharacterized protein n=1 Tax=Haliotis cracherodii TaxID=6455 RepID=UPI0039E8596B